MNDYVGSLERLVADHSSYINKLPANVFLNILTRLNYVDCLPEDKRLPVFIEKLFDVIIDERDDLQREWSKMKGNCLSGIVRNSLLRSFLNSFVFAEKVNNLNEAYFVIHDIDFISLIHIGFSLENDFVLTASNFGWSDKPVLPLRLIAKFDPVTSFLSEIFIYRPTNFKIGSYIGSRSEIRDLPIISDQYHLIAHRKIGCDQN